MPKKRKECYVVWKGRQPGVYGTWAECQAQVSGYPGAQFRGFDTREQAEAAFRRGPQHRGTWPPDGVVLPSYAVDAACSGNPGAMEYRCVEMATRREVFRNGPMPGGTNNIGEFLAIVEALSELARIGEAAAIYSDSAIAIRWVTQKKCRTDQVPGPGNQRLFAEIRRAEAWLATHAFSNPILKWDTERWGENPADFGRK